MLLVTHTDLDGVGCEVVARCFFPQMTKDNVYHCDYANVNYVVCELLEKTDHKVLITDVSVTEETAAMIDEKYRERVMLYDHHQTVEAYLKKYDWCVLDMTCSATQILFENLCRTQSSQKVPISLPLFVFYVNDYDMWHHTMPYSTHLNDMVALMGKRKFAAAMLKRLCGNEPLINEHDQAYIDGLAEHKELYFRERVKKAVVIENRLVVLANRYLSDLSQYIRNIEPPPENWKNVQYVDMINIEKGSHSLRSYDPDFDVSEVAKKHGGGGHKKAAGYLAKPMTIEQLREY